MKYSRVLTRAAAIVGITLGAFAISALADWTAPGTPNSPITPPSCPSGDFGCDAPLNVSATTQYKKGGVGIGQLSGLPSGTLLDVFGTAVINDMWTNTLHVTGSAQTLGAGRVLTDVNGDGNATWQPLPTGTGGGGGGGTTGTGVTKIIPGTNITISPITGVGDVTINAQKKGSVGGACYHGYANGFATQLQWFTSGGATWDAASGSCTCPTSYSAMQIGTNVTGAAGAGGEAYLCVAN